MTHTPWWLSVAGHGLGAMDWQRVLRRTGMPFRSPAADPHRAVLAVGLEAAGGLLVTAGAAGALLAATGVPRDSLDRSFAPAGLGALAPLPVAGVGLGALAEGRTAWRCAQSGTDDTVEAALRLVAGLVASGLAHAALATVVARALEAVVPVPPPPAPAPPASRLNVAGPDVADAVDGPEGFVVYLDGVGRCERRTTPVGREFADAVAERLPRWIVVLSLMPNDVTQEPAWLRPVTGRLWRRLHHADPRLTLTRGVWEAVVAVDPRYRDRLADAHTRAVVAHLEAAGYRSGSGAPVVLVGLSGGAQTALHVASDVARALGGAPVDVVTFGAFADGAADLEGVRRVHSVVSWGDPAELLPVLLFPSRWVALGAGAWHRAKRSGTVVVRHHDYAAHIGSRGYLGTRGHAPDGRTRLAQAADLVATAGRQLLGGRARVVR